MVKSPDQVSDLDSVVQGFRSSGYIVDRALATSIYLLIKLGKPLLIEGHAGVGKTEVAKALAAFLDTELIRLQCYEGLDVSAAVYEWNYQKQLLAIKLQEGAQGSAAERVKHIFGPEFLLERPLLRSIRQAVSPVLLIDEVDRADEAFEAFLLELLSDFQISIPEMGSLKAVTRPYVVLTSNRTRELSDALKRRCLYHWIDYPSRDRELEIVRARLPFAAEELREQAVRVVQSVRQMKLSKPPGVAETLDLVQALTSLETHALDAATLEETLGCISKSAEDIKTIKSGGIEALLPS
jgi:MoxR-like ATPase